MIKSNSLKWTYSLLMMVTPLCLMSQDSLSSDAYQQLSLKDLLNVKIITASRSNELVFDAPLSASVITREEIRKAGATSIMEALRLIPGMIIREQSNGNYDIHIRGLDNVPPNSPFDLTSNTTTLVMIDNRPIYSYLKGGTFWETLPIDLNDVEKIEVVRGPAAALYGPNAVSGVINIITSKPAKEGWNVKTHASGGSAHTSIQQASAGYRASKWSAIASGNYQYRHRTQSSYYEYTRNSYLQDPSYMVNFMGDTFSNIHERFPRPELSMKKYGANIFMVYDHSSKTIVAVSTGLQYSTVQRVSVENEITPLSTNWSSGRYIDLKAKVNNINAQVSYNKGTQNIDHDPGNKYDYRVIDANVEYHLHWRKLSVKPGISYRSALYDDTPYSDTLNKTGIFNARGEITVQSAFLRTEYRLLKNKLRLVAGVSTSTFNYPDTTYLAYEFAATYKLNNKHLFRWVYAKAPRSSTIFDTYVHQSVAYFPVGNRKYVNVALIGNKNLDLLNMHMMELGYRSELSDHIQLDVEIFDIQARHFSMLVSSLPYTEVKGIDTITVIPIRTMNLPAAIFQRGLTLSVNYAKGKVQVKPFITLQRSIMTDYSPYNRTPELGPDNILSGIGTKQEVKSTPRVFGGASANYGINRRWNVSMTAYGYSSQTYYHLSNIIFMDGVRGVDHLPAKLIVNINVTWEALKGVRLFVSGKNILNSDAREFYKTDKVPAMVMGGVSASF